MDSHTDGHFTDMFMHNHKLVMSVKYFETHRASIMEVPVLYTEWQVLCEASDSGEMQTLCVYVASWSLF